MPGKVKLRDDGDAALRRVCHDVAHFVLGVEPSVIFRTEVCPVKVNLSTMADRAEFSEAGVFLDFHPPALVFCQMPVEDVFLVDGHYVQTFLDFVDAVEMASNVDENATVGEARGVLDGSARDYEINSTCPLPSIELSREHLPDGLKGIDEAVVGVGGYDDLVFSNVKPVGLVAESRVYEEYNSPAVLSGNNTVSATGNGLEMFGKFRNRGLDFFV